MRPVVIVIRRERSQPSIIFVLASQYRSHSVPLVNAAHCLRRFLSVGSRRLHSMQKGSGRIPKRWRCVPRQSCPTHNQNYATVCKYFEPSISACFGAFATSRKALTSFTISILLSAHTSDVPPRRISVKFDPEDFYENLSRKSKFC
jgi:hypothetical protein